MPSTDSPRRCWNSRTARSVASSYRGSSGSAGSRPSATRAAWTSATAGPALPRRISCTERRPLGGDEPRVNGSDRFPAKGNRSDLASGQDLQVALEGAQDGCLRLRTDDRLDHLAALEHGHGRDRHDLVVARSTGVLVDVELDDVELVAVLAGDLLEHGRDHLARAAPLRPEVDQHGLVALQHVTRECRVGDGLGVGAHGCSLLFGSGPAAVEQVRTTIYAIAPPAGGPGRCWTSSSSAASQRSASSAA